MDLLVCQNKSLADPRIRVEGQGSINIYWLEGKESILVPEGNSGRVLSKENTIKGWDQQEGS